MDVEALFVFVKDEAIAPEAVAEAFAAAGAEAWAATDGDKRTPLHHLMMNSAVTAGYKTFGHLEVVGLALEKAGAEAWAAADGYQQTPLHYLIMKNVVTAEVVGLAFEKAGAEAWVIVNSEGNTPLGCLKEDLDISGEEFVELFRAADPGESLALFLKFLCGAAHAPHRRRRRRVNQAPQRLWLRRGMRSGVEAAARRDGQNTGGLAVRAPGTAARRHGGLGVGEEPRQLPRLHGEALPAHIS
jgi:hypothetical protein